MSRYRALVLLGCVPVLALALFAYLISARAVETLVDRGNDAAALITAALIEREFEQWTATMSSHAAFPTLATGVAARDVEVVRRRLEIFVTTHSRLDRAFVTDTTGVLWVDFPVAPGSLGRRFDQRDWFVGVSRARGRYVSEVYRRSAEPQIHVVAVAVPVLAPSSGELAGYLVAQIRLDSLTELLGRVEMGESGIVLLRDHAGALAAHPSVDLQQRLHRDYAHVHFPVLPGGRSRGRYADPFTGQTVVASSVQARVGDHQWTVISQQPVEAAFAPIRSLAWWLAGSGALVGLLVGGLIWGVARENARRRRAEGALAASNEELEQRVEERSATLKERETQLLHSQKMEAVGRLAGGVAHDFNNLLTVILGCTELLLSGLPQEAPERQELEPIRSAALKASELTRQLLAFSRKQVVKPEVLDLNEAVRGMGEILERVLGEDIDLVWRLRPGLHPLRFDPSQIEQVIMNLAVNARDAMPAGGRLTIETGNVHLAEGDVEGQPQARPGPHVVLAVTDTGTGMDARTSQKIFEPFFTTKEPGKGTGLGLSTVYGIVQQGRGKISVVSEPGRGTTFEVFLPAASVGMQAGGNEPIRAGGKAAPGESLRSTGTPEELPPWLGAPIPRPPSSERKGPA